MMTAPLIFLQPPQVDDDSLVFSHDMMPRPGTASSTTNLEPFTSPTTAAGHLKAWASTSTGLRAFCRRLRVSHAPPSQLHAPGAASALAGGDRPPATPLLLLLPAKGPRGCGHAAALARAREPHAAGPPAIACSLLRRPSQEQTGESRLAPALPAAGPGRRRVPRGPLLLLLLLLQTHAAAP